MMVKICGITNQPDAQASVDAGANALGFNFYKPSPRYINPQDAAKITAIVPRDILKVGVFVNESPADVVAIVKQAGLDVVQLHGKETVDQAPLDCRVWKAFRVNAEFSIDQIRQFPAEAYLLDSPTELYGGSGHAFNWHSTDWDLAGKLGHIILAGGLDASNIRQAIAIAKPWGVDACSRLESTPGKKDHTKLSAFLKALQNL